MLKINRFADEYEIRYDVITDHDVYEHLRVSIEIERGAKTETGIVCLNGVPIGEVDAIREPKQVGVKIKRIINQVVGFKAYRYLTPGQSDTKTPINDTMYDKLGRAASAIISDYVR